MTRCRIVHALLLSLLLIRTPRVIAQDDAPAAPPPPPAPELTNPALAERLAAAAQDTLRNRDVGEPSTRATAALLRAATRLAPPEPRFFRLLSEAVARMHDDQATKDWFYPALSEALNREDPARAKVFQQFLDSPRRVILRVEPTQRIGYDGAKMGQATAEWMAAHGSSV